MRNAVVVSSVRSPIGRGRANGQFSGLHPVELLSQVLQGIVGLVGIDPGAVDDVIIGCVSQAGEQAATPGRLAWLAAGFPEHVPSTTIDRRCGSSQQALAFAVQGIEAGAYDIVIAGGVESMSRVPMGSARMGADVHGPSVTARYAPGLVSQGISAELIAARWAVSRGAMDAYAVRSHERAASASNNGLFTGEIVAIDTGSNERIHRDETIREGTTVEALAHLTPSFVDLDAAKRFPEITWSVTAGNSSQISDGASAVLVMSEERARSLNLEPLARIVSSVAVGTDPVLMLSGPIPATKKVLERSGLSLDDIGHYEINEAFASVPLVWQREFNADPERINPVGGAIALGHPLGASGARLFTSMLHSMRREKIRFGLQAMCEAGGMANALVVEVF